ncbi:MAG TPA: recombinase family protein [Candidatus Faecousia intestinigallinarum]|nr:recombinase family protein [Candidatus Faecousia intestinigallinarum]
MKKKRALPYGYTIQNGRRTIEKTEADIIRRIFAEYQSGASMAELAATMTALQIPYCEKRVDWNKSIIARILSNPRYAGADGFAPIIDIDVFKEVNISKSGRTKRAIVKDNSTIGIIRARILCGECESRMVRFYEKRNRIPVYWRCDCPDCRSRIALADETLERKIIDRMNLIIENPHLLEDAESYIMGDLEVQQRSKITAELSRMCDTGHYTDEQLLTMILEDTQKRYDRLFKDQGRTATAVCLAYSNTAPSEKLNTELFLKTVSSVLMSPDGSIQLRLISGKII